jgi:selenide,water dikinase
VKGDSNLIVGLKDADDAGVYRLNDGLAIIQTVDFITPVVDDPYDFGRIAAANSLSDVWAMGGRPVTAMNIVCFPRDKLEIEVLKKILSGALACLEKAGAVMIGGHSIKDDELKFGLSVTGVIHPDKVITKSGAKAGDRLILTKPLGTGILNTALKANLLDDKAKKNLVEQMAQLNKEASEVMVSLGARACTDVTGFGLMGHACEMAEKSSVSIKIIAESIPLMEDVAKWADAGMIPAGLHSNRDFRVNMVEVSDSLPRWMGDIIYDPQTSGGLLIAVPEKLADEMLAEIKKAGYSRAAIIGEVIPETKAKRIIVE